jgi:hypothetical protein
MSTTLSFRLTVVADADPVVLIRLVERIQSLALVLRQFSAHRLANDLFSIELVASTVHDSSIELLAKRIAQFVTVHSAEWEPIQVGAPDEYLKLPAINS